MRGSCLGVPKKTEHWFVLAAMNVDDELASFHMANKNVPDLLSLHNTGMLLDGPAARRKTKRKKRRSDARITTARIRS